MKYNVIGYESYIGSRKVYFQVDADSKEEALQLALESRADEIDAKDYGGTNYQNVDIKDWYVEDE